MRGFREDSKKLNVRINPFPIITGGRRFYFQFMFLWIFSYFLGSQQFFFKSLREANWISNEK